MARVVAAQMVAHWHAKISSLKDIDTDKIIRGSIDLPGKGTIPFDQAAAAPWCCAR